VTVSSKLRFEVFKRDGFTCQYCGRKTPAVVLELDHIDPKSKGGGNEETNLITSCFDCNRGKGARVLSSVIPSAADRAERVSEAEAQLRAYRKELAKVEKRKQRDLGAVNAAYQETFKDQELTRHFLEGSVRSFIEKLPLEEVEWSMRRACDKFSHSGGKAIKYFCGICWTKIKRQGGDVG
jgi:hypothetical protein